MTAVTEKTDGKEMPKGLDLNSVKFDEHGNADYDFVFASREQNYTLVLYPEIKEMAPGVRNVKASAVVMRFNAGRFVLNDAFRDVHYTGARKLNDLEVLRRICRKHIGYGYDHFFAFVTPKGTHKESYVVKDNLGDDELSLMLKREGGAKDEKKT